MSDQAAGVFFTVDIVIPTGCATRFQQAGCVIHSDFRSHLGHSVCLLVTG